MPDDLKFMLVPVTSAKAKIESFHFSNLHKKEKPFSLCHAELVSV
jgi:hypothetical protein